MGLGVLLTIMRFRPFAIPASLLLTLLAGCAAEPEATDIEVARSSLKRETAPNVDDATLSQLVRDNEAFEADLYKQLGSGQFAGKNMFFSAGSVSGAFAMLYGGARGDSEREIATGMHFTLPQEKLHASMNKLALEMETRSQIEGGRGSDGKGFRLSVNNSFWGERTTTWEKPYLDLLAVNYDAGINLVSFTSNADGARKTINSWTEAKTENRIKELLPSGSVAADTRFVLVNTVYFNAAWREDFDVTDMSFTNAAGVTSTVPAMRNIGSGFRYAATDDAEVVSVPYEGGKLEFVAVMPKALDAFEAKLDGPTLDGLFEKLEPMGVDLTMPKVKIDGDTVSLKGELQALGMNHIFGGGDFSGMTKSDALEIADVFHKAFVKINEKGTEAAAATAIVGRTVSAILDPKVVSLNKPYIFFVRDQPTKAILFTGRVVAPEYAE
jgi:serpin B